MARTTIALNLVIAWAYGNRNLWESVARVRSFRFHVDLVERKLMLLRTCVLPSLVICHLSRWICCANAKQNVVSFIVIWVLEVLPISAIFTVIYFAATSVIRICCALFRSSISFQRCEFLNPDINTWVFQFRFHCSLDNFQDIQTAFWKEYWSSQFQRQHIWSHL